MLQVGRVGETGAKSDDVTSAGRGVRIDAGGGTVAPRGARGSRRSEGQAPAGRASRDRSHGERVCGDCGECSSGSASAYKCPGQFVHSGQPEAAGSPRIWRLHVTAPTSPTPAASVLERAPSTAVRHQAQAPHTLPRHALMQQFHIKQTITTALDIFNCDNRPTCDPSYHHRVPADVINLGTGVTGY
ncbi:hypothetical protein JYU34_002406 [Plutella xylostella]|uniref:Uncharacterized protein n=1 Tax=Plutella xylostella TaxID=51655 RepID=A0ABQ7R232_PLUXY|nr:hypothetical protein JYU34_002406 [Plutella xylostella]